MLHQAGVEHLGTMLDEFRPDVVVLDPLVSLCAGGNMNDNAAMSARDEGDQGTGHQIQLQLLGYPSHQERRRPSQFRSDWGCCSHRQPRPPRTHACRHVTRRSQTPRAFCRANAGVILGCCQRRLTSHRQLLNDEWYELRSVELPNPEPPTYPHGDGVQAIAKATLPAGGGNGGVDMSAVEKAVLDVVDAGKLVDGTRVPYSPNKTGAANARGLTDDALAAIRQAVGHQTSPAGPACDARSSHLKPEGVGRSGGG